jgi:hypothetical protein
MAKSTRKKKTRKKVVRKPGPGRPTTTGAGTPMVVRMHKPQLKAIDRWIGDSGVSRPAAIRQLVDWALEQIDLRAVTTEEVTIPVSQHDQELHRG